MLIETAHGHVFDHACPQWADGTLGGIGGHQGFLSRAEGCWTFDARDRTPRPSRATAHHFVENALTQTPAPSRASGFVLRRILVIAGRSGEGLLTEPTAAAQVREREPLFMSSRPEDSHLRALPDPYVNLSIHTAPDVRPFPWQSCQWAKSVGFARRSRSNQSRAPLVLRRNRLNLRRAQRMT